MFPRLGERIGQRAGSLSGGERQMLAMGRALMMEPQVLLLDEPSAGLSPVLQDQVFERVQQVNDAGVSIIMVEQNAARCLQICDRGYVLDQGRNAYTGTGDRAAHRPQGHRAVPRHARQGPLRAPGSTRPSVRSARRLRAFLGRDKGPISCEMGPSSFRSRFACAAGAAHDQIWAKRYSVGTPAPTVLVSS